MLKHKEQNVSLSKEHCASPGKSYEDFQAKSDLKDFLLLPEISSIHLIPKIFLIVDSWIP